jgi:hypothetical protein
VPSEGLLSADGLEKQYRIPEHPGWDPVSRQILRHTPTGHVKRFPPCHSLSYDSGSRLVRIREDVPPKGT